MIQDRLKAYSTIVARMDDAVALMAAQEIGVFQALMDGPMTCAELSARCAVVPTRLRAVLNLVVQTDFLIFRDDHYELIEGDAELFDPTGPWQGALTFADLRALATGRGRIVDILRAGDSTGAAGVGGEVPEKERTAFLRYLHQRSAAGAAEVAELLAASDVKRIVDLGCGLGTYTAALLHRMPDATAVLVDRENARGAVEAFLAEEGLTDRAEFRPVDFLSQPFGEGFDLALVSNVIHCLSPVQNKTLMGHVAASVRYGGRVAIKDIAVERDRSAPTSALRFAFNMAVFSDGGDVYSEDEVVDWVTHVGLDHETTIDLRTAAGAYLVIGRRPQGGSGVRTVSRLQERRRHAAKRRAVILGVGVAGLASAVALRRAGFDTINCERAKSFTSRGLAFLVMNSGVRAMDELGLGKSLRRLGAVATRATVRDCHGNIHIEADIPESVCVRRAELVLMLRSLLPGNAVQTEMEFTRLVHDGQRFTAAQFRNGDVVPGGIFIGADGVRSSVRRQLFPDAELEPVRVMELVSMARAPRVAELLKGRLLKTFDPDGGLAVGMVACGYGSVVWFIQYDSDRYEVPNTGPANLRAFSRRLLGEWPDPLPEVLEATDFNTSYLWRTTDMELASNFRRENALLIGDAAHPYLTFTSQGVSSALNDGLVLGRALGAVGVTGDLQAGLAAFNTERHPVAQGFFDGGRRLKEQFLDPSKAARTVPLLD